MAEESKAAARHTPESNRLALQALWDAHRELMQMRNRLSAAGCKSAAGKIEAAIRSVTSSYAACNARVDADIARATGASNA